MILAVVGAILIIAGVAIVVRKTAETWLQRRAGRLEDFPSGCGAHRPRSSAGGDRDVRLAIALRLDLRRAVADIPAEFQWQLKIPEPPPCVGCFALK